MIGGGLALNDIGFYTGSGNVPYVQCGSVGDFISEPRCSKSVVGLQTGRRKEGCTRGPVGFDRKGRGQARCSSVCSRGCELSI